MLFVKVLLPLIPNTTDRALKDWIKISTLILHGTFKTYLKRIWPRMTGAGTATWWRRLPSIYSTNAIDLDIFSLDRQNLRLSADTKRLQSSWFSARAGRPGELANKVTSSLKKTLNINLKLRFSTIFLSAFGLKPLDIIWKTQRVLLKDTFILNLV